MKLIFGALGGVGQHLVQLRNSTTRPGLSGLLKFWPDSENTVNMADNCQVSSAEPAEVEPVDEVRVPVKPGKLSEVNQEPGSRLFRTLVPPVSHLLSLIMKRDWDEAATVPQEGPAIICANHISSFDPVVVGEYLAFHGRWPYFLAKDSLFKIPGFGKLLRAVGQIPVHRGTVQAKDALVDAENHLGEGKIVVIYPEGTVCRDPDLWPMMVRTGAARLALKTGAPVIPIGQWGAHHICPDNGSSQHLPHLIPRQWVSVRCGAPVDLSGFGGPDAPRAQVRAASLAILEAITTLVEEVRGETAPPDRWNPRLGARVPRDEAVF
jgi:1-acyl-sn-glycerol-3-phosphate acyltransferase